MQHYNMQFIKQSLFLVYFHISLKLMLLIYLVLWL